MQPLSDARLAEIDRVTEAATPGPWSWYGNTKMHNIYLATVNRGRQFVMTFRRWGMRSAQPCFQPSEKKVMIPASELVEYEADYRKDFHVINNPDAAFIALSRTAVPELLREVERLQALAADGEKYRRLKKLMETWWANISCFPWKLPGHYCAHIDNVQVRRPVSARGIDPLAALEAAVKKAEEVGG